MNPGKEVQPGVPSVLHPLPDAGTPPNRLTLARWLVSPENPLVGRVTMNRLWSDHFGKPLVKTPENLGTQGERPSHPALLDWLATELVEQEWSMKAMHRMMVTSATYRQDSRMEDALRGQGPGQRSLCPWTPLSDGCGNDPGQRVERRGPPQSETVRTQRVSTAARGTVGQPVRCRHLDHGVGETTATGEGCTPS